MKNSMDLLRKIWPEWEIVEKIGEGTFGCVYKIVRNDTGKDFYAALKIIDIPKDFSEYNGIKSDGLDEESAGTFFKDLTDECLNEIKIMYSLKGTDNIVSIEDYKVTEQQDENGRIQYHIFIRMELLQNLGEYIEDNISGQNKETICNEVIKIGTDLCSALELCSKENIIHRDIKMQNVFVSSFGKFKLGDFNISKHLEDRTSAMSRKGTMGYLAPEVYNGNGYNSSVDIYSLGMLLYRILNNNRAPFLDPNMPVRPSAMEAAVTRRLSGEKIESPINATPELAAVILKSLEYEPSERYATASEFKAALLNAGEGKTNNIVSFDDNATVVDVSENNKQSYAVLIDKPVQKQESKQVAVKKSKSFNKWIIIPICVLGLMVTTVVALLIGVANKEDDIIQANADSPAVSDEIREEADTQFENTEATMQSDITLASITEPSESKKVEESTSEMAAESIEDKNITEETSGRVTVKKEEDKEFKISYTSESDKGVELVPECESEYFHYYNGTDGKSFSMGGIEYTEGFVINDYVSSVTYKLDGKYTNMHFICGKLDSTQGRDTKVVAHLDGKEKDVLYHADYIHLPEEVNIDVTGVNELTLNLAYGCWYGFADIYFNDDGTVPPASVYTSNVPADKADLFEDINIIEGYEHKLYTGEPNDDGEIPKFTMLEKEYDEGVVLYSGDDSSFYGSHIAFNMRGSNYTNVHFVCGKVDKTHDIPTDLWIELDGEKQLIKSFEKNKYGVPIEFDIDISGAEVVSIDLFDDYAGTTTAFGFTDFYFYNKELYQKSEIQKEEAVPEINPAYIWQDIEPFEIHKDIEKYNNYLDKKLSIAGIDYDLGIKILDEEDIKFNNGRRYNKLVFKCGRITDTSSLEFQIKAMIDGEEILIDTFNRGDDDIREYEIDITDAEVIRIYVEGHFNSRVGIADLYFCNTNYPMDTQ